MPDDDGRKVEPSPGPRGRRLRVRLGCLIAVLTLMCLGGYILAGKLVGQTEAESSLLGRFSLSLGALAAALASGWASIALGRHNWRLWRLWTRGEVIMATIEDLAIEEDYDGDRQIRARVSGRTRTGWTFDRWLLIGYYQDPGPVGGTIRVRYHEGLREISLVERGVGGMITNAILWLLTVGTLAVLIAMALLFAYGLVDIWI